MSLQYRVGIFCYMRGLLGHTSGPFCRMEGLCVVTYMETIPVYSSSIYLLYGFFDTYLGPSDIWKGCVLWHIWRPFR